MNRDKIDPVKTLSRRIQHIFDIDPIPPYRVIDEHMRDRANQPPILNDGAATHE